ncbi:cytochrome P450 18a1 [Nephila pilipes]|uniref:Cytochrome P450 18a1 n=2 Tax=Nephila pilipes TaxID=299642 RepID=A0A8X6Q0S7_NEPPI|nr:cytochrome P450 18a1 [Nephila pilipes]
MEYLTYFAPLCAIVLVVIYNIMHSKKRKLPPGPFNLPFVGYLPFLGEKPHITFQKLSEKYGPVFRLRLGMSTAIIITDYNIMKEAFSKSASLNRPPNFSQTVPDGMGLSSVNGQEWIEQRRYTVKTIKHMGLGKSKWQNFVQDEVDEYVQLLEKQKGKPFDPKSPLIASIANNIFSLIFGYRLPHESPQMSVIIQAISSFPKLFDQTGLFLIPGMFTFFKIAGLSPEFTDMIAFNNFFREEVDKKKNIKDGTNETSYAEDYLYRMKEESKEETSFQETHLLGNIQSLMLGGTETIAYTLLWSFLAMAIHPEIQQKVQEEVDSVLGKSKPQWTEHLKLPYTYAAILECMRWRTMVPNNALRWTREDVQIGDYDVPKNTVIIASLWNVQNDSKIWKNPSKFIPDRFIDDSGKVMPKPHGWVPFSLGKRNCPGDTAAMIELFLYFTTIIQKFTILVPDTEPLPDLDGTAHLLLIPKPYKVKFVPRL